MTSPFKVVTVSSGIYRLFYTLVFTQAPIAEPNRLLSIDSRVIELADIAAPLGVTLARSQTSVEPQAVFDETESADLLLVASPVYHGSYPGLLKHLFNLIGLNVSVNTPVLFTATDGTECHALILDHQLCLLFSFFQAIALPIGVYTSGVDPDNYRVVNEPPKARIRLTAGRAAPLLGGHSELLKTARGVPMNMSWLLPIYGDGHFLGISQGARPVPLLYLMRATQAADSLGHHGVLILAGRSYEDSWVVALVSAPLIERLRFLAATRPGVALPTVLARIIATLDHLLGGHLLINIVTGGDPDENRGDSIYPGYAECYEVTDELPRV